jgi:hypothetical protein
MVDSARQEVPVQAERSEVIGKAWTFLFQGCCYLPRDLNKTVLFVLAGPVTIPQSPKRGFSSMFSLSQINLFYALRFNSVQRFVHFGREPTDDAAGKATYAPPLPPPPVCHSSRPVRANCSPHRNQRTSLAGCRGSFHCRLLAESPVRQLVNGRIVVIEFEELESNASTVSFRGV